MKLRLAAVDWNEDSWSSVVNGTEGCLDGELGRARLAGVKEMA